MPNRLIREGWLDSEAIDRLTPEAERFFHRLCLTADDAGRFDGRRDILRARLFPLKASLRASDVDKWLQDCITEGLVIPYTRDGKPFVQVSKWQRCSPCVTSKFPWIDGSFRITYIRRETRDGEKEFVLSSVSHMEGMQKGSEPIEPLKPPISVDGDDDEDDKSSAEASSTPSQPPVLSLPALQGKRYDCHREYIARLQEQFPACHVEPELRKMQAWLEANPRKGKTLQGMARFVVNWLSKTQDRGGSAPTLNGLQREDKIMRETM